MKYRDGSEEKSVAKFVIIENDYMHHFTLT